MSLTNWIALLAGFGIGSIVAGVLARWSVISGLRQKWINALRNDIAAYLRDIELANYHAGMFLTSVPRSKESEELLSKIVNKRIAAQLLYRRILLRLNNTETLHITLASSLTELLGTATTERIEATTALARQVLKREWQVTKYGIFFHPVMAWRRATRR